MAQGEKKAKRLAAKAKRQKQRQDKQLAAKAERTKRQLSRVDGRNFRIGAGGGSSFADSVSAVGNAVGNVAGAVSGIASGGALGGGSGVVDSMSMVEADPGAFPEPPSASLPPTSLLAAGALAIPVVAYLALRK
jgi:hypothetical protein